MQPALDARLWTQLRSTALLATIVFFGCAARQGVNVRETWRDDDKRYTFLEDGTVLLEWRTGAALTGSYRIDGNQATLRFPGSIREVCLAGRADRGCPALGAAESSVLVSDTASPYGPFDSFDLPALRWAGAGALECADRVTAALLGLSDSQRRAIQCSCDDLIAKSTSLSKASMGGDGQVWPFEQLDRLKAEHPSLYARAAAQRALPKRAGEIMTVRVVTAGVEDTGYQRVSFNSAQADAHAPGPAPTVSARREAVCWGPSQDWGIEGSLPQ